MTRAELINKIASESGIAESEEKLFFDLLLKRFGEELNPGEFLSLPGLGKFEYKKSAKEDENDYILFITDNDELLFYLPQNLVEDSPIDSHFSISIGKPVIPFRSVNNHLFIPQSDDEVRRMLELKVEKFIEDFIKNTEEVEEENLEPDIQFSFLNWKKSSDTSYKINSTEDEVSDTEFVSESDKAAEEKDIEENTDIVAEVNKIKNEDDEEKTIEGKPEEINENNLIEESSNKKNEKGGQVNSDFSNDDKSTIVEAFKYAEKRNARFEREKKRSRAGFIFAGIIFIVTAAIIFFTYYFPAEETKITDLQTAGYEEFKTTNERNNENPVSSTDKEEILSGNNKSSSNEKLNPVESNSEELISETIVNESSKIPEIRDVLPSKRLKGYIYQYEDNTLAVQVSSWKSRSVAFSETQKYINAGSDAFIEQTTLSGSIYYRVRIGGFKTIEEAEQFLSKK